MRLVADRFAMDEDGGAFDLSTGTRVAMRIGSAGGVSEQLEWNARCTERNALRHRASAALLDFGLVGESSRFEAWGTGYPAGKAAEYSQLRIADLGLRIVERPAVAALAEMFHAAAEGRPQISALWGPRGAGKRSIVEELARIARTRGFVPVAARLIGSRHCEMWCGRSLFVIADAAEERAWESFLNAAVKEPLPHVLLLVGEHEQPSIAGVFAGRVSADALVSAVDPAVGGGRLERSVRRAAERARGLPGRFAGLLWRGPEARVAAAFRSRPSRVAEQQAVYGRADVVSDLFEPAMVRCAWPVPSEVAALRRRMDHAVAALARGRQAPGIRLLRQVVGSLARRGAWKEAAAGSIVLCAAVLRRGGARDTLVIAAEGREYANRADDKAALLDLAILSGHAWIDLGRLDEADSVIGTALAAARAWADPARVAGASLALARLSYWRGAYTEADTLINGTPDVPAYRVRRTLLAARVALGLGDLPSAISWLTKATEEQATDEDGVDKAAIAWVSAVVRLAAGDLAAAERDLSITIAHARATRDSPRAMRARVLLAEIDRARGRAATALAQLDRLSRVMKAAPLLVRARWNVARALAAPGHRLEDVVSKHTEATGLGALALYVSTAGGARQGTRAAGAGTEPLVEELVAILRVCQTAADEIEVLRQVCARLRQHLHAAAVIFAEVQGEHAHLVASDGARFDLAIASGAAAAGITIAPRRADDRIEAAAPIEYGGQPIGALCARWTIGSTHDTSRAGQALTMAAAVAAPAMAAALARRSHPPGPSELLGVASCLVDLRRSVERAAAAPFAVLVDGESGSGKELVARAIHRGSDRRHKPLCIVNCAALPDDLIEAELFGHIRGAFTGAVGDRPGVFEEAHGGTLFLDEVGELTPRAQAKLLRVIQEGELRRIGENVSRRVDVRIVSATNRALRQEVDAGRFRLDLLYRLDVIHITVPPLRERREDVPVLAEQFWRDAAARVGSRATLGAETLAALARYDWPGNVRELQNVLAALAVRAARRGVVPPSALPPPFVDRGPCEDWTLDEARRTFEVRFVRAALVRTGGHRGRAAAELGVTRQGLTKLMTRLGIQ
jgi:DNA-binding NtrC family response regulator